VSSSRFFDGTLDEERISNSYSWGVSQRDLREAAWYLSPRSEGGSPEAKGGRDADELGGGLVSLPFP